MLSVKAQVANTSNDTSQLSATFTFERGPLPFVGNNPVPPTDAYCRKNFKLACFSPQELRNAYGLTPLIQEGYDGTGQTIVIVVPFGSPTIEKDLHIFDQGYKLPDPPSFQIVAPLGTLPYRPTAGRVNWATETTLDVEWSHAMAPGANIVLVTCPSAQFKELLDVEQYSLQNNLGHIISQSWAATENTFFTPNGRQVLQSFDDFYKHAAANDVTIFAASGDTGVANPDNSGKNYPFPTVNFPASDPYVTAVGGTGLETDTHGVYQSEIGWNGSGGGVSQFWKEPTWQDGLNTSVQHILNGNRGLPDIAYNADPAIGGIFIYTSFSGQPSGFSGIDGTSQGAPQWSGIIADGDQFAGESLGFINPLLYKLGIAHQNVFHDITIGNNTFDKITGYNCVKGWDPVTGWGSPQATNLIIELTQLEKQR